MKPCNYCHGKPRRVDSPYCSDRCAAKKHQWNITHSHNSKQARVRKTEQERIEAAKIYQREYNSLRKVRRLLRETDDRPNRLTPVQRVRVWNIVTDEIKIVKEYEVKL